MDRRELCIMHANCQGEPLAMLLAATPAFASRWRITHYTNYIRETIPQADLDRAGLFLYQFLGPKWEEFASDALLARLRPGAANVCLPNMVFNGYWPFLAHSRTMDFADFVLDRLIESGARKPEILKVYLHGKVTAMADLDGIASRSLEIQREKDSRCVVDTSHFIAEHWKSRPLFQTSNHPDVPVLLLVADAVLAALGLPPVPDDVRRNFRYDYQGFVLPIHPAVGEHFGLDFARSDTRYRVFGRSLTFAQYVSRYIDCRMNGLDQDFLGYLQLI